ncbi:cytochrome C [Rhodovastum atsumiense]|uniref:Cytochrome C n=1 Tax=Rhodovastum atsumiense TaxID=504468 RepID=A0A5M6ISV7_9PROT|nr:cytochrome C [Rhodovastum atsumiense]KAA5611403.1 cytochrome C [Rhodovastum atsumiense]
MPLVLLACSALLRPGTARAVPSFAQQTGQPCATCHVGAFGPQLTPFGRAFKIGGYTMAGGTGPGSRLPLAAMLQTSFTHTGRAQPEPPEPRTGRNNNAVLDQISLFYAGRITDWSGAFVQGTYDGIARSLALDNTDIRPFTTVISLGDTDLRVGTTVNNGPTVQDPYNSIAWGYPFFSSSLAPTPAAKTLLGGGNMIGNAVGVTAYGWYGEHLYAEFGGYGTYGPSLLRATGTTYGPGSTVNLAPYARLAYEWDWNGQAAHIGGMLLHASFNPTTGSYSTDGSAGHDSYTDWALDAGYQFIGTGEHIVSAYGIFIGESQDLAGATAAGTSSQPHNTLSQVNANLTYYYRNTYGLTVGWQTIWGKANPALYAPAPVSGSANGKPNSNAFILEADWVPFGKADSWGAPWVNMKLGVQYTLYTHFNGGTRNYDGSGRKAADNNTVFAFAWLAF